MRAAAVAAAVLVGALAGCAEDAPGPTVRGQGTASASSAQADLSRAAVRPGSGTALQALTTGTLSADPTTGCLWVTGPDGRSTQLLLQGPYRVDVEQQPVTVSRGDTVVATVGDQVVLAGGHTGDATGVAGCPVGGGSVWLGSLGG